MQCKPATPLFSARPVCAIRSSAVHQSPIEQRLHLCDAGVVDDDVEATRFLLGKRRKRRDTYHGGKRKLSISLLHRLIDLRDRLIKIRAGMNLQLYVRPILEVFPVTTRK